MLNSKSGLLISHHRCHLTDTREKSCISTAGPNGNEDAPAGGGLVKVREWVELPALLSIYITPREPSVPHFGKRVTVSIMPGKPPPIKKSPAKKAGAKAPEPAPKPEPAPVEAPPPAEPIPVETAPAVAPPAEAPPEEAAPPAAEGEAVPAAAEGETPAAEGEAPGT